MRPDFSLNNDCVCVCVCVYLKKNVNASRPSEHPPVRGGNVKTFSEIIGCKDKTSYWH